MTTPAERADAVIRGRLAERTPDEQASDEAVMAVTAPQPVAFRTVTLNPGVAYSSKPGVGKVISAAKHAVIKLEYQVLQDMVDQFNAVMAAENAERRSLQDEVTELRSRVEDLARRAGDDA